MSCVTIHWPPNEQQIKCVSNVSNPCSHSYVRKLDAEGWIEPKQKRNTKMKVKCAIQNKKHKKTYRIVCQGETKY
jgi:hypothetical protein